MRLIVNTLNSGLKVVFLHRPEIKNITFTADLFWFLVFVNILVHFVISYLITEPPKLFNIYGFESMAFNVCLILLASLVLIKTTRLPYLFLPFSCLILSAETIFYLLSRFVYTFILSEQESLQKGFYYLSYFWWGLILFTVLSVFLPYKTSLKRILICTPLAIVSLAPLVYIYPSEFWITDYYKQEKEKQEKQEKPLNAEEILFGQAEMLNTKLSQIQPSRLGKIDLFFVGFGSYGKQNVFRKEINYVSQLFIDRFNTKNRTISLINHRETIDQTPLASVTNLERSLSVIADKMNLEEDILFIYLTSHGYKNHKLSVKLKGVPLNNLPADKLAQVLKKSKIKWKVIVISACYSGGFIDYIHDDHTLVITASSKGKKSFGCSNSADFTYFGKAFFKEAIPQTDSFTAAYYQAAESIKQLELSEKKTPSEPQMASSVLIEEKLREWRLGLSPLNDVE